MCVVRKGQRATERKRERLCVLIFENSVCVCSEKKGWKDNACASLRWMTMSAVLVAPFPGHEAQKKDDEYVVIFSRRKYACASSQGRGRKQSG